MFKQCKVYKGHEVLKIYSTWEKNDLGKLHMIAKKMKMFINLAKVCKPPAPMKTKITENIEPFHSKHRNLAVKTTPKFSKSSSRGKPVRKVQYVVQVVKLEKHQEHDYEEHNDSKEFAF